MAYRKLTAFAVFVAGSLICPPLAPVLLKGFSVFCGANLATHATQAIIRK